MSRQHLIVVVGLLLTALLDPCRGWADELPEQPKIGLVLSGGGALGAAHVGVLKVLEELHIPVHCIAGTSMGAIVGGLYASGVSTAEMEQILAETDWRAVFDDRPPRRELPYRLKVDDQTYLTRFEAGFNHGKLQLPAGLVSGQQLGFVLQTLVLAAAGINNFDDLPIPFRAVATDIETGEMVVLGNGDLGHAIRASMSIPGVFAPIEINRRLLVDGGLVRNLPVDVVKAMGADVVIAVDVGVPLSARRELSSLNRVLSQAINIQMRKNVMAQAVKATVLIKPDLDGFSSSQFERGLQMVPRGEEAARAVADALQAYALPEQEYAAYLARVRTKLPLPTTLHAIELSHSSSADPARVMSKIKLRPGDPFTAAAIREDLERLYETGDYERVDFFLSRIEEGFVLHIEAHDKSWGPNFLRSGLNLFADLEGESSFDFLASYTMSRLNRLRGELKVHAQLGESPAISGELYQPLSHAQTWFTSAWMQQSISTTWQPVGDGLFAPYRTDLLTGGVDLGLQLSKYGELRFGLLRSTGRAELRRGEETDSSALLPQEIRFDQGAFRIRLAIDQLDSMSFPRQGYFSVIDYVAGRESLGDNTDYERLAAFAAAAVSHHRHTLFGLAYLYSALGSASPEVYSLGGLFRLSGLAPGAVAGRYGGSASLLYLYRLLRVPPAIGDGLYLGASIEAGNLWNLSEQVSLRDLRYAGSIVIGIDTVFGPLYLAQGFAEGGNSATYLYIGRTF